MAQSADTAPHRCEKGVGIAPTPKLQQLFIVPSCVQNSPNLNNRADDHVKNQIIADDEVAATLCRKRQISGAWAAFRHCGQAGNFTDKLVVIIQGSLFGKGIEVVNHIQKILLRSRENANIILPHGFTSAFVWQPP